MSNELKTRKNTKKEIKRLEEILSKRKYEYLSNIMLHKNGKATQLTIFLFELIEYSDKRRKERSKLKKEDPYYKNISCDDIPLYCKENELLKYSVFKTQKQGQVKVSRCINILTTLGLIEKKNPYEEKDQISITKNRDRRKKYIATGAKKRSEILLRVPFKYTKEILKEANNRAKKLLKNGYIYGDFSKDIVIITFGQEFADRVFLDNREQKEQQKQQQERVKRQLRELLKQRKLITIEELKEKIKETNKKATELLKDYDSNKGYIERCIRYEINEEEGKFEYRELSKEEKKQYGIEGRKKYIIRKDI